MLRVGLRNLEGNRYLWKNHGSWCDVYPRFRHRVSLSLTYRDVQQYTLVPVRGPLGV